MHNFEFRNPVKIIFGKNQISSITQEIPGIVSDNIRVLVVYGGGSIKANGVLTQVKNALSAIKQDIYIEEFSGVEANPDFDTLMKAVKVCRDQKINFILAVGGGSVVDGVKFIAAAVNFTAQNTQLGEWELFFGGAERIVKAIPFGVILTLPATGSEMNMGAVISRRSTGEKVVFRHHTVFPKFSVLDPEVTYSLPARQLANGIVDPFIHVTEQYLTTDISSLIQDSFAEGVLKTLIDVAPKVVSAKKDYAARANWMWACTNALNGFIGLGIDQDWATHQIGHELTAKYALDHAQTLAIIAVQLWRYKMSFKRAKLLKFAKNVWGMKIISGDTISEDSAIANAIICTEEFFREVLGVKTRFSEYGIKIDTEIATQIAASVNQHNPLPIGENKDINQEDIIRILLMAK
jgi:NADP-dependent alcohol dehydrogenase